MKKINDILAVAKIKIRAINWPRFSFSPTFSLITFITVIVFAYPFVFIPVLSGWFDLPKQTLILLGVLIITGVIAFKAMAERKIELIRSPFDLPAVILVTISLVSACLANNRWTNIWSDPITYFGAMLLFLVITHVVNNENSINNLIKIPLFGAVILSGWGALQLGVILVSAYFKNPLSTLPIFSINFNPTGSYFTQLLYLAALLPVAFGLYLKTKEKINLYILVAIAIGFVLSLFTIYKNPPALLPWEMGWKIATGVMGNSLSTALIGVGPANYVDAFSLFKPASYNLTNFWNMRFGASASFYLYLLSTIGIIGLTVFIWIVYRFVQIAHNRFKTSPIDQVEKGLVAGISIILISFLLVPGPMVIVYTFFFFLAVFVVRTKISQKVFVNLEGKTVWLFGLVIAVIMLTGFIGYNLGRLILADYYFGYSVNAVNANQGAVAYENQIKALSYNPDNDNYHLAYSQTNLALADTLAGQPNLTDQQKQTVTTLVQQAIREGRSATTLNPQRAANWENLSMIYRSLISFAQGADQWTTTSLNQAIALDPVNPRLRLDLGGVYFNAKDYVSAAQLFNQAVNLKPDFANAHYNLAQALKNLNLNTQAVSELQLTANLICIPNADKSADCQKVEAEIAEMGSKVATPSGQTTQDQTPLSTAAGQKPTLKPVTTPPAKIASPSGQITP